MDIHTIQSIECDGITSVCVVSGWENVPEGREIRSGNECWYPWKVAVNLVSVEDTGHNIVNCGGGGWWSDVGFSSSGGGI